MQKRRRGWAVLLAILLWSAATPATHAAQPDGITVWNMTFQFSGAAAAGKQNNFNADGTGSDSDDVPFTYTVSGTTISWTYAVYDQCQYTGSISLTSMSGTMLDPVTGLTGTWSATPVTAGTYSLAVIGGTGAGLFSAGTTVTIIANPAPAGQVFDQWSGATVANVQAFSTTLAMPAAATTVLASYVPMPVVTSVTPAAGTVVGGTPVTIAGSNFSTSGTVGVNFGSTPATNVVVASASNLTCDTPAVAVGTVAVTVINPGKIVSNNTVSFTFAATATVKAATLTVTTAKSATSSLKAQVDVIPFLSTLTQLALKGTSVSLTLAGSITPYTVTLGKTGEGKNSTGLTALQLTVKSNSITFTISKDPNLNGLIEALPNWSSSFITPTKGMKKPPPFTLVIPALLNVNGASLPLVATFNLKCQQSGTTVKGSLVKPSK